jgi:hypothetical protein
MYSKASAIVDILLSKRDLTLSKHNTSELNTQGLVTLEQGVARGLAGPLAGCGVSPLLSLIPPPKAAQKKTDLNSYKQFLKTTRNQNYVKSNQYCAGTIY